MRFDRAVPKLGQLATAPPVARKTCEKARNLRRTLLMRRALRVFSHPAKGLS